MRRFIKYLVVAFCIIAFCYLIYLFIFFRDFSMGFFQNFYSDIIVGIAIAYFITWYINKSKKIELEVFGVVKEEDDLLNIDFNLINIGDVSFEPNKIYYNIIFVKKYEDYLVNPEIIEKLTTQEGKEIWNAS